MAGHCFDMHAWSLGLLGVLGNAQPSTNTVKFVIGWGNAEAGGAATNQQCNQCDYNMLNMSAIKGQEPAGVTGFCVMLSANAGICKFDSVHDAFVANGTLIKNGYPSLYAALKGNNETALGFKGTMSSGVAADLAKWSGNAPNYAQNILASAGVANLNISQGGENSVTPPGTPASDTTDTTAGIDWYRVGRGAIGAVMLLAGLSLMIKAVAPNVASTVISTAVKSVGKASAK